MKILNSNAYKILICMYDKKQGVGISEGKGRTMQEIVDVSGLSFSTVRRAISVLIENELVAPAIKRVNTNAYYVTQRGIDRLSEISKKSKPTKQENIIK